MTAIARLDPFGDVISRGSSLHPVYRSPGIPPRVRVDVAENDTAYTAKAEIPGVKKEDTKVSIDGMQVSISAEVTQGKLEQMDTRLIRSEPHFDSVVRSFGLPRDIDDREARARYNDGVLELTLSKKGGGSARDRARSIGIS